MASGSSWAESAFSGRSRKGTARDRRANYSKSYYDDISDIF